MVDNVNTGTGVPVATDVVTYSGDADKNVQLLRQVHVTGSEGSKTVQDVTQSTGSAVPSAVVVCGGSDGTNARALRTNSSGELQLAAGLVDDTGFTVATSRVVPMGLMAVAHGSAPDAADASDAVIGLANRHRVQFTIGGHPNVQTLKHANITTAVTNTAIVTVSAGTKIAVTRLTVTLDNASTVFPTVLIGFATATTPTTTGVLYAHGGFPAGGGQSVGDGSGIIGVGADDEDLRITTTGNATGNGLQITVSYFTIES